MRKILLAGALVLTFAPPWAGYAGRPLPPLDLEEHPAACRLEHL